MPSIARRSPIPSTVKQVAELAGVSTATVSRVVNQDPRISAETTARVRAVIDRLGYSPNPFARSLKTSRSRTIGCIVPEFTNDFFMGIAKGVEARLRESRYSLVMCNANETASREGEALDILIKQGVDGILVIPSSPVGAHLQRATAAGVPVVLVDRLVEDFSADAVLVDNIDGTVRSLGPLFDDGLSRMGFIGGKPDLTPAQERYAGFLKAHEAHGLAVCPDLVRFGDFHTESGFRLMGELLAVNPPPEAVFLSNYFMHVGATRYLMEHRSKFAKTPVLVAFDDMELSFTLEFCRTIVRQPMAELGTRAAELLLDRLRDPQNTPSRVVRLKTEVVER